MIIIIWGKKTIKLRFFLIPTSLIRHHLDLIHENLIKQIVKFSTTKFHIINRIYLYYMIQMAQEVNSGLNKINEKLFVFLYGNTACNLFF